MAKAIPVYEMAAKRVAATWLGLSRAISTSSSWDLLEPSRRPSPRISPMPRGRRLARPSMQPARSMQKLSIMSSQIRPSYLAANGRKREKHNVTMRLERDLRIRGAIRSTRTS